MVYFESKKFEKLETDSLSHGRIFLELINEIGLCNFIPSLLFFRFPFCFGWLKSHRNTMEFQADKNFEYGETDLRNF